MDSSGPARNTIQDCVFMANISIICMINSNTFTERYSVNDDVMCTVSFERKVLSTLT